MPIIYLSKKNKSLFINLHEFLYTPGAFEMLFLRDQIDNEPDFMLDNDENENNTNNACPSRKEVGGQPSLVSKFPFIIDEVAEFVEAPNKGHSVSKRYMSYVNARVGTKGNSYREYHRDAHYLFARYKMRRELASLFSDEVGMISVDDMSKIKVGAPAVSRYHQIKRIFPENDQPNLKDHDFPVPGYLITVSGHMLLTNKNKESHSLDDNETINYIFENESSTEPNFNNMIIEEFNGNPFEILSRQADFHLNIKMTSSEFKDAIKTEVSINAHLLGTTSEEDFFLMIDDTMTLDA